jgi:hypothetical protein
VRHQLQQNLFPSIAAKRYAVPCPQSFRRAGREVQCAIATTG